MAWLRKKNKPEGDAWSMEETASKRRRLEKEEKKQQVAKGNEDFDDSMELTQAELETLDIMASQAVVEEPPGVANEEQTSDVAAVASAADEMLSFAKPSPHPLSFTRRSTSSSSNSSAHPASLTSRSASDASGSLSSHTSENGKADVPVDTIQSLSFKLEQERKKAQEEKYKSAGELAFLRKSLRRQEEELERVRAERDSAAEKEKQEQQESEKVLQTRLDSMVSEAQFRDREFKNLQEQYQSLQHKLKKLEQSKQDQPSPSSGLASPSSKTVSPKKVPVRPSPPSKQRQRQMEEAGPQWKGFPTKHTFMEQTTPSASITPSNTSVSSAACQTAGDVTGSSTRKRRLKLKFPAPIGTAGAQVVQHLLLSPPLDPDSGNVHTSEDWDPGLMGLMHAMSTTLRVAGLTYSRAGARGSASLSPIKPKGHTPKKFSKEEGGGTLQVVSKEHFQLAVDGLSQLLDARLSDSTSENEDNLAFLRGACPRTVIHRDQGNSLSNSNKNSNTKASTSVQTSVTASTSSRDPDDLQPNPKAPQQMEDQGPDKTTASAALILPLLTDYIQHYVDLLSAPLAKGSGPALSRSQHHPVSPYRSSTLESTTSPNTNTASGSFESSLDSLNSSVLQLLHDGHIYAAGIEGYTAAALRCTTLLLLLCPALVDLILAPRLQPKESANTFVSSTSGNSSAVESDMKAQSEVEADDEKSTSSPEIRILAATCEQSSVSSSEQHKLNSVQSPVLFHLVLQLAGQDLKDSSCAPDIMAQSLHVLSLLCQNCCHEHLPKLESIAARGVLTNCLRQMSNVAVLVWSVRLVKAMAGHMTLFSVICAKSENCPLYLMHRVNFNKDLNAKNDQMVLFYKEYISCLSSMVSDQHQGLHQLLSNACPCSNELVPGVVLALYRLFQAYQLRTNKISPQQSYSAPTESQSTGAAPAHTEKREECCGYGLLWTLGQGVMLLHAVAQADSAFLAHHSPVQPEYISLLYGMRAALRVSTSGWEFHLSALEELCDFEPDLSDSSQESESEDRMDQG